MVVYVIDAWGKIICCGRGNFHDILLPNSTNGTIYNANIFGVGHDIDPSAGGDINYMIRSI